MCGRCMCMPVRVCRPKRLSGGVWGQVLFHLCSGFKMSALLCVCVPLFDLCERVSERIVYPAACARGQRSTLRHRTWMLCNTRTLNKSVSRVTFPRLQTDQSLNREQRTGPCMAKRRRPSFFCSDEGLFWGILNSPTQAQQFGG